MKIFRDSLISYVKQDEKVKADNGYIGELPMHVKHTKRFTMQQNCAQNKK